MILDFKEESEKLISNICVVNGIREDLLVHGKEKRSKHAFMNEYLMWVSFGTLYSLGVDLVALNMTGFLGDIIETTI